MNPEQEANLRQLVLALRSGEYKQTHLGQYRTANNEFCANGLAYHLLTAKPGTNCNWIKSSESQHWRPAPTVTPLDVIPKYYGIKPRLVKTIDRLNDDYAWSFKRIATLLEAYLTSYQYT